MLSSDQQQSSASCLPPLPRLIWFLLVDSETGEPYKNCTASSIEQSLLTFPVVAQFRDAVHAENFCILTGIDPLNLLVYKNKAAFDRRNNSEDKGKEQPLKSSRNLDGLGESEEEALIIVVPSPRDDILVSNKKTKETTSYRFLLVDSATGQPYKGTSIDAVSLSPSALVFNFRDAVHAKNPNKLAGTVPSQLLVYKNKAAFDRRNNADDEGKEQPLSPTESIGRLGSKEDMLVVAVPPPIQPLYQQYTHSQSFPPCQIPFFNSILTATERDGRISFGQEEIPSTHLNTLYIRECYRTIASRILPVKGIHKAIITGTPGIGKSLFLIYLLWRLVKEGKRVLFIYGVFNIYYDENGVGSQFESGHLPLSVNKRFWNDTLWCLFDAKFKNESDLIHLPVELSTFIVSTSPRREMVNDFRKPPVPQVFYMPIWKESELETIAPLFPEANKEWRGRFDILGGIPRHVLEDTTKTATEILDAACRACSLDDCMNEIGINSTITEKSKAVHSLIHIISRSPFTESSVQYASATAMDTIVHKHNLEDKQKMRRLLASCEGNSLTAALCGYIFERHAIELLEKGGSFTCRKLVGGNSRTPPSVEPLLIPPSTKIIVDKVSTEQPPKQLHVPKTKNYAGIDAWIPGIGAFQMTVSKKHDINERTRGDLAKLGAKSKFYFALPPFIYSSFTKQKPQDIDQYAILILYPE